MPACTLVGSADSLAPAALGASSTSLAVLPLLEPRLSGKRVAVIGNALSGLGPELAARGARVVAVLDDDHGRVAEAMVTEARRGVSFGVREDQEPLLRPGSFDLVVVPELDTVADVASVVSFARGVCPTGVVVLGASAAGSLGYYDLHALAAASFDEVRMVGRLPWSGVAFVDFAQGGDGVVSVDTSLREDDEPEAYLAFCSARPVELPAYALVGTDPIAPRVPIASTDAVEAQAKVLALSAEVERGREERRGLDQRIAELDRRLAASASALAEAEALAARPVEAREDEAARARVSELETRLLQAEARARGEAREDEAARARVSELETRLLQAEARARDAERTLTTVNVKAGAERDVSQRASAQLRARITELEGRIESLRAERPADRSGASEGRAVAAEGRVEALEGELGAARAELANARGTSARLEGELGAARAGLADARGTSARLEGELGAARAELVDARGTSARLEGELGAARRAASERGLGSDEDGLAVDDSEASLDDEALGLDERAAAADEDGLALDEELSRAEDRLRDRAREIGELRRQLDDRASLVHELLARVEQLEATDAHADAERARLEASTLRQELERERASRLADDVLRGPPGGLLTYPRG